MITVLSVIGTRPEAIKMAPVLRELNRHSDRIRSIVCSTGQHHEILKQVFDLFQIRPDIDLKVMRPDQSLSGLTARLFDALDPIVREQKPDWILAQGDTTTVLVASLIAFYHRIQFGHVEAGLRTGDLQKPFPEELNRCVADKVASAMFAPTERSRRVLLTEGLPADRVFLTGNTVIDALYHAAEMPYDWSTGPLAGLPRDRQLVLVTAHRRESFGGVFREMCMALRELAERHASAGVFFVYPVHPNPNVRRPVEDILTGVENVRLLEPLDYLSLVHLMKRCRLILTDSGGIQEEAPGLRVPVLVMRDTTERPEGVEAGVVRLVGVSRERIVAEASRLLTDPTEHRAMTGGTNPYGDGHAAERIVAEILQRPRS